jgi:hypothetical protein
LYGTLTLSSQALAETLRGGSNAGNADSYGDFDENPGIGESNNRSFGVAHLRKQAMRTLLASSTVLFTIVFSLAFGIACGYVAITAILRALGHKPKQRRAPARAIISTVSGR